MLSPPLPSSTIPTRPSPSLTSTTLPSSPAPLIRPAAPLTVRLFAGLREAAGWGERLVGWDEADAEASRDHRPGAGQVTPRSLWRQLQLGAVDLPAGLRVAVNHPFASSDQPLQPGDELAFLPPISGG